MFGSVYVCRGMMSYCIRAKQEGGHATRREAMFPALNSLYFDAGLMGVKV